MSHATPYSYERAPIEVKTTLGRNMSFEVDRDGDVYVTVEVDDHSVWIGARTAEVGFYIAAEDWRAIVTHIERDLPPTSVTKSHLTSAK